MANFKTHYQVATIASASLSATFLAMNILNPGQAIHAFLIGSFSGLMPDVDSPHSISIQVAFSLFSLFLAIFLVFSKAQTYSLVEIAAGVVVIYVLMQGIVIKIFKTQTVHRGLFHSIPAAVLYGLLVVLICYYLLKSRSFDAWLFGFFACFGYLIHLTLDEIYSVDLNNQRLKSSFGTALKLFSWRNGTKQIQSVLLYMALFIAFHFTPSYTAFADTIFSKKAWHQFLTILIPYSFG